MKFLFIGVFAPIIAKYTKHLPLVDILAVGVDHIQRSFEPMRKQVEVWKKTRLLDEATKLIICQAFVEPRGHRIDAWKLGKLWGENLLSPSSS